MRHPHIIALFALGLFFTSGFSRQEKQARDDNDKKEKERLIKELLPIIRDKKLQQIDKKKVEEAIQTLGAYRVEEAIPDLVELLEFAIYDVEAEPKYKRLPREELYPAYRPLREMGDSAIPFLIKAIGEKERSAKYLGNAKYLLLRNAGNMVETKKKLDEAIMKEKDKEKVKRLKDFQALYRFEPDKAKDDPKSDKEK